MGQVNISNEPTEAPSKRKKFDPEVDELAKLLDWEAKQKKHANVTRLKELKAKYQEKASEKPAADSVLFHGEKHILKLGAKAAVSTIADNDAIRKAVGDETFFNMVTVPLGKLKDATTKDEYDKLVEVEQTGSRSVKMEKK